MTRSTRHTPVTGWTMTASKSSEQRDKAHAQRRLRHAIRRRIGEDLLPLLREVSNVGWFGKGGKQRIDRRNAWYAKAMRK